MKKLSRKKRRPQSVRSNDEDSADDFQEVQRPPEEPKAAKAAKREPAPHPCPLCGKTFQSGQSVQRGSHLKSCGREKGLSTEKLLEIKRLEMRQEEERRAIGLLPVDAPTTTTKTRQRQTGGVKQSDPQLDMALAISASMNPKCGAKPVLMTRSDPERQEQISLAVAAVLSEEAGHHRSENVGKDPNVGTMWEKAAKMNYGHFEPSEFLCSPFKRTENGNEGDRKMKPETEKVVEVDLKNDDSFADEISENWLKLLESGKNSDLTIYSKDGKSVECHSLVLFVRCPSALDDAIDTCGGSGIDATRKRKILSWDAADAETIDAFLRFVYGGKIASFVKKSVFNGFLRLAKKFGFDKLEAKLKAEVDQDQLAEEDDEEVDDGVAPENHEELQKEPHGTLDGDDHEPDYVNDVNDVHDEVEIIGEKKSVEIDSDEDIFAGEDEQLSSLHDNNDGDGGHGQVGCDSPELIDQKNPNESNHGKSPQIIDDEFMDMDEFVNHYDNDDLRVEDEVVIVSDHEESPCLTGTSAITAKEDIAFSPKVSGFACSTPTATTSKRHHPPRSSSPPQVSASSGAMKDYDLMLSPALRKELKKFGLKAIPRRKAVPLLRHIQSQVQSQKVQQQKQVKEPSTSQKSDDDLEISSQEDEQDQGDETVFYGINDVEDENDLNNVDKKMKKVSEIELAERVKKFIVSDQDLYLKVLTYHPIWLEDFLDSFKSKEKIRCSSAQLVDIFDAQCVTFRTKASGSRRKNTAQRLKGGKANNKNDPCKRQRN